MNMLLEKTVFSVLRGNKALFNNSLTRDTHKYICKLNCWRRKSEQNLLFDFSKFPFYSSRFCEVSVTNCNSLNFYL